MGTNGLAMGVCVWAIFGDSSCARAEAECVAGAVWYFETARGRKVNGKDRGSGLKS